MTTYSIKISDTYHGKLATLSNDWIGDFIHNGKIWETHVDTIIQTMVGSEDGVMNIGTHIGTHAIPMAKRAKVFYGFEPQPILFWLLGANLVNNGVTKYHIYNNAVGHQSGVEVTMEGRDYQTSQTINYGATAIGTGTVKVKTIKIDDLDIKDKIRLILVDVEGMEPAVFHGARKLIARDRPVLVFERNYLTITEDMKRMCGIDEEVSKFLIEDFVKDLNYNPLVAYSYDVFLVPKPEKVVGLADKYKGGWEYQHGRLMKGSAFSELIIWYEYDRILAVFQKEGLFTARVAENGEIHWDKSAVWYPEEI